MFNPSRDQVRNFFIETWRKYREKEVLTPMESVAANVMTVHPEYHAVLEDPESVDRDFPPEAGQINPFLHLSLHLAIEEQLSIDQPPGIRTAFDLACQRRGDRHDAMHDALEALGEMLFDAQRNGTPPDGAAYIANLRRRIGAG